jgi:hypothetical protein
VLTRVEVKRNILSFAFRAATARGGSFPERALRVQTNWPPAEAN